MGLALPQIVRVNVWGPQNVWGSLILVVIPPISKPVFFFPSILRCSSHQVVMSPPHWATRPGVSIG